jgi:mRNA interferase MazF
MKQVFYTPERGDVVRVALSPDGGLGQTGRRTAVVLSPQAYNSRTGLAAICPVTKHIKGYPFEVLLPEGFPIAGAILADQAESLDWRAHRAELICALPRSVVDEALGKLRALLEPENLRFSA